jgi:hypothetical protein
MQQHYYHSLLYPIAPRDKTRPRKLHQLRDVCAAGELWDVLRDLGFRLGYQIFNRPPDPKPGRAPAVPQPPGPPLKIDLSFVKRGDLLLQLTRPPFSDIPSGAKRKVLPSHTDLELRLFALWKKSFLLKSARDHMIVHTDLHGAFRPGFEHGREIKFGQKGWGAPYQEVNAQEGAGMRPWEGKRTTTVYLLRVDEAWKGGPGYLCAFGMDGCTTLFWAHLLAKRFRHLLEKPGFVIGELELGELPEHVTDLRFCEDWKVELALVHEPAELALV